MKIFCPKCHTCYSIEVGLIPADGKKLRCARCGEVWLCTHKDMKVSESSPEDEAPQNVIANTEDQIIATPAPESEQQTDQSSENSDNVSDSEMTVIFSRLKDESNKLDSEINQLPTVKKFYPKIKKLLGWNNYWTICVECSILLLIICLSLFAARYEIVRRFPQAETVYSLLGIPSRVIGEGLEFQNIVRSYNNPEKPQLLSINGFIHNNTSEKLPIPTILVNMLDDDAVSKHQVTKQLDIESINPQAKIPFTMEVDVPVQAKFILLTFTK